MRLSEDLSLAFTIACISRGATSERCQPRELSSVKGSSWMRMWSRGSRVTSENKRLSLVCSIDVIQNTCCPILYDFLFHWGFVFCSRCLLITFQFKRFWEEFCVVPANSGQDKLEDKVWFLYACLHNYWLLWCWMDIFGFVMQNIYSVLNHSRNVMRVSRSVRLAVSSCVFVSLYIWHSFSIYVCNSLKQPIQTTRPLMNSEVIWFNLELD